MYRFEVTTTREGKTYKGNAVVEKGMITVSSVPLGTKSASVSANNEVLAKIILNELVYDYERTHK